MPSNILKINKYKNKYYNIYYLAIKKTMLLSFKPQLGFRFWLGKCMNLGLNFGAQFFILLSFQNVGNIALGLSDPFVETSIKYNFKITKFVQICDFKWMLVLILLSSDHEILWRCSRMLRRFSKKNHWKIPLIVLDMIKTITVM